MQIDWREYNERRKDEGTGCNEWMPRMACKARKLLGLGEGVRGRRVSAILVAIVKSESNLSYGDLGDPLSRASRWPKAVRAEKDVRQAMIPPARITDPTIP